MEPIFEFSAAPHLPHTLRLQNGQPAPRPENVLGGLLSGAKHLRVFEHKGEIYIDFAEAA